MSKNLKYEYMILCIKLKYICTQLIFIYRYPDGSVKLRNPHIELMDQDILYHLALGSESHDLVEMFGDVKVSSFKQISYVVHSNLIYLHKF